MKSLAHVISSAFLLVLAITWSTMFTQSDGQPNDDDLVRQVAQLEQRVEKLERILFSTAKLSVTQAERRLAEMEHILKNSENLFARGYINAMQVQQDRFNVQQAKQELRLAKAERRQNTLVGELDVLGAEQNLIEAKQRLEFTRDLARREFASSWEVERAKLNVDTAERVLKNAQEKLKASEQLDSLKQEK